ncbi:MAG: ParM/StbA family protein [Firmicutes bacterium]|nr:ParM/StbA family protein [Bacillota bacterium]
MSIGVGLDVGYGYNKIVRSDRLGHIIKFPSISGALSTQALATAQALSVSYAQWEYNGTTRLVGDEVYHASCRTVYRAYDANRVDNEHYKFLALVGLARVVPENMAGSLHLRVVTGLPNQYFLAEREALAEMLRGRHQLTLRRGANVVDYTFIVDEVKVLPQSIGGLTDAYLKDNGVGDSELLSLYVGGIDIGFRTVDPAAVNPGWRLDPEALRPGGDNLGMATVAKLCESHLATEWGVNLGIHEVDEIVRTKKFRIRGEVKDLSHLVDEWKRQAAVQIWEFVGGQWDRLKRLDRIYFMGGGAEALYSFLVETAPKGITQDLLMLPDAGGAIARGFAKASLQWQLAKEVPINA